MKRILLAASALVLAGCNWGGSNYGHQYSNQYQYGNYHGHNGYQTPVRANTHGHHRVNSSTALEFSVGAEEFTGGNIVTPIFEATGQINKTEYKDIYDTALRVSAGIAHDVAPRTTLIARGFYKDAQSSGDRFDFATRNTGQSITGNFSDFKSYGAEVGFREYLHNNSNKLRPYMGGTVGAAYMEAIDFENGLPFTGTTFLNPMEAYESEWVPTASAVVGVDVPVGRAFSMTVIQSR